MFNRIFSNWKTSVLGLAVLIIGFGLVFLEKTTLTEFGAFILTAFVFFFSKDPKKQE